MGRKPGRGVHVWVRGHLRRPHAVVVAVTVAMAVAVTVAFPSTASAQDQAIFSAFDRQHPVVADNGMVATQEAVATRVGVDILERGGNAVDAAVAVGFALAVTLPRAGNLGGGGFMLVHLAETGETVAIDYRETAPAAAARDMFLDADGNADAELSRFHGLAVGVPGTVAGLALALERYGTMSLAEVLAPAIALAEDGITVTGDLSASLIGLSRRLKRWPSSEKIFFKRFGLPYLPGETLVQSDLAGTLRAIADAGPRAFYTGPIAEKIAAAVTAAGGVMTVDDLAGYAPVVRSPVAGTYQGYEIRSMPPPSSGGVHIVQILNILEGLPIAELGHNTAETIHLMAEAMKLAYADRSEHLGDSDFVDVPVAGLTSKAYAETLRSRIYPLRARPATEIKPGDPAGFESTETTHYSIVDRFGNAVANTYTINFSYGSGLVADGTGVLLNNEMDDFSAKPGVPNAYGLIGGDANAVAPGKRPLSSMSPTIVLKDGKPVLVTGSPGGSRIITTTLQIILNVIDHGMNIAEATEAVRVHHQWLPDELRVERGLSRDTVQLLEAKGHSIDVGHAMGSTQSIVIRADGTLRGASDPRTPGALTAGH
jgi:gamma-glutamyltranspeptidase / glutathione hydrolase